MTMQRLCQQSTLGFIAIALVIFGTPANGDEDAGPVHSYPTQARVEYVNECIAKHDDSLANVYQCSCAIDRIADVLTYDEFVGEGSQYLRIRHIQRLQKAGRLTDDLRWTTSVPDSATVAPVGAAS